MEISIVKDILRGTPHVIVARSGQSILAKSVTKFGTSIASSIQASGKIDHKSLPDGFGATEFKHVSENVASMVMESYIEPELERIKLINKAAATQTAKSHNERNILMRSGSSRAPSSIPLRLARSVDAKLNLIDYKASKFKVTSRLGSVVATLRSSEIGFDSNRNILVAKKNNPGADAVIERIVKTVGHGPLRRFMQADAPLIQEKASSRRAERRAKIISSKSLDAAPSLATEAKIAESIKARFK